MKVKVSPKGCADGVDLDLRSVSKKTKVGYFWFDGADLQRNGAFSVDLPHDLKAGKHTVRFASAYLSDKWADRNNLEWSDTPTVILPVKTIDIRFASTTTLSAKRAVNGIKLTGTVKRIKGTWDEWGTYPNRKVRLQKKVNGKWVTKKTVTSNANGKFSTVVKDSGKGSWRARTSATKNVWGSTSTVRKVAKRKAGKASKKVTRSLQDYYPTYLAGTVTFDAGGGYVAAPKGTKVKIQKRQKGKWVTKTTVKTNAKGKYRYSLGRSWQTQEKRAGKYRVVVPATSKYKAKTSSTISFYP